MTKLWSINLNQPLVSLKYQNIINGADFTEDEKGMFFWTENRIFLYNLFMDKTLDKEHYPLEAQVETGTYITTSGEVKNLTQKEWQQKKKKYEQILKESNP